MNPYPIAATAIVAIISLLWASAEEYRMRQLSRADPEWRAGFWRRWAVELLAVTAIAALYWIVFAP